MATVRLTVRMIDQDSNFSAHGMSVAEKNGHPSLYIYFEAIELGTKITDIWCVVAVSDDLPRNHSQGAPCA